MSIIEELISASTTEEQLTLDEFIDELRSAPEGWYGFRVHEVDAFVGAVLARVAELDTHDLDTLKTHFGLT